MIIEISVTQVLLTIIILVILLIIFIFAVSTINAKGQTQNQDSIIKSDTLIILAKALFTKSRIIETLDTLTDHLAIRVRADLMEIQMKSTTVDTTDPSTIIDYPAIEMRAAVRIIADSTVLCQEQKDIIVKSDSAVQRQINTINRVFDERLYDPRYLGSHQQNSSPGALTQYNASLKLKIFSAFVLFYDNSGVYLLSRKDGRLGMIGGKIDPEDNLSPLVALIREVKEEVGLQLDTGKLTWLAYHQHPLNKVSFIYAYKIDGLERDSMEVLEKDKHFGICFFKHESMASLSLLPQFHVNPFLYIGLPIVAVLIKKENQRYPSRADSKSESLEHQP